jgi:cyclohexanecarboxylate-CoA ligase
MWDTLTHPDPDQAAAYLGAGWWRRETFLDDLAAAAARRPEHPAIIGYRDDKHERTLTYAELAHFVARFAAGLTQLGVGRGDVVGLYLPNRWILPALYLACSRVGAICAPLFPALGVREVRHILQESGAALCVTVDRFAGLGLAARLAEAAPEGLRHQVVVYAGDAADDADRAGAIDFEDFFVRTPWEERHDVPADAVLGPDEPSMLLYTSGTTGRMKGTVHSQNTFHAAGRTMVEAHGLTEDEVVSVPHFLTHMAGASFAVFTPLTLAATCVMQDSNTDMALLLDLIQDHGVTWAYAAPGYQVKLVAEQRAKPRDLGTLRMLTSGSAPVPPPLIDDVREVLGVRLHALWGMTENGGVTLTRPEDPEGWAAHSDGSPMPWMSVRIDDPAADGFGRLLVRGASQCLGYLGQREVYQACLDAEGWFDTGDLARDDGRGGIRIGGRRADMITRANGYGVSPLEIEGMLARYPGIGEVVLVGYPDPKVPTADLVCVVVVPAPAGSAPTLADLHAFFEAEQVAPLLWPDRVVVADALPKNSLGKVLRATLRTDLETIAGSAGSTP